MTKSLLAALALMTLGLVACSGAPAPDGADGDETEATAAGDDALSLKRSKRNYCCIQKAKDIVGTERVSGCKRIRDYRDELGRASARGKCEGFHVDLTSPSIGFGAAPGSPINNDLVSALCDDRGECQGVTIH